MIQPLRQSKKSLIYRIFCSFLISIITLNFLIPVNLSYAQVMPLLNLPLPGSMVGLTPGYNPVLIKGITLYPDNPLEFDFLINSGNSDLKEEALKEEANKLIKYFLASLTVPEEELWVNLSPYEKDRIIPNGLGGTEMGRDLLAQDYVLKQLTASLIYPEDKLGKEFWQRVYAKAQKLFGTTEIPINTFNKIWIVPGKAVVYEKDNHVFVIESSLKVMLEEDYVALQKNMGNEEMAMDQMEESQVQEINKISSDVVREVLIPEIEKEVNEGKSFANLRQIHNSLILATWYKMNLKESLLGQVYADKNKIKGVDVEDKQIKEKIYQQYLEAFKKGVYNYIKEDFDPATQEIIPRQYFSGGGDFRDESKRLVTVNGDQGAQPSADQSASFKAGNAAGDGLSMHTAIFEAGVTPAQIAVILPEANKKAHPAAMGKNLINKATYLSASLLTALTLSTVTPDITLGQGFPTEYAQDGQQSNDGTLLIQAAGNGDIVQVKYFLRGVNVNAKSPKTGATALMMASQYGHTVIVQVLLAVKGIDVNIREVNGATALMMASKNGRTDIVHALLAKGADANAKNNDGWTALMLASGNGRTDIVQALLVKGADANAKNNDGWTALMMASLDGHTDIVHALLAKGADVNWKVSDGVTALMWASQEGHTDIVHALLAKGADVAGRTNNAGATALMMASKAGHTAIVQALLAKGADANAKNNDGWTALMMASENGHTDIVHALLAKGADVNGKAPDGATALFLASQNGHTEVVHALLAKNADVNMGVSVGGGGATALFMASQEGHTDVVQTLLAAKGIDVNLRNSVDGATALIMASKNGRTDIVQALLAKGADVNARDNNGWTALIVASLEGHTDIVHALLAKGADVNLRRTDGTTALFLASQNGHTDIVQALLAKGADVNLRDNDGRTALMVASQNNHTAAAVIVQALLAKGADVNGKAPDGATALFIASQHGHAEIVQALLAKGGDVNVRDNDGWTALIVASGEGHTEVVQTLLAAKGIDVNTRESLYGATALIMASKNGRTDIVQALLAKGADVNLRDNDGRTALMVASQNNHTAAAVIVQALLAKGADVNLRDNDGRTALMVASQNNHMAAAVIVQALLAKGIDVNLKANNGATALMVASQSGHTDIVQALLAKGADVNLKNNNGDTALMIASQNGHTAIVQALLAKGADVNLKNNNGKTALDYAKKLEIINLLKKAGAQRSSLNPLKDSDQAASGAVGGTDAAALGEPENTKSHPGGRATTVLGEEDEAILENKKPVGGINLNPAMLDLQIKRDGNGVPLPLPMQPIGNMKIEGFFPVIINITPINLPLLMGFNDPKGTETPANKLGSDDGKNKFYREKSKELEELTVISTL